MARTRRSFVMRRRASTARAPTIASLEGSATGSPMSASPKLASPRYVIAVHDLERSARYYRDVLGFEVKEVGDPGWRFFLRDECFIMAGECKDAVSPKELGDH